MGSRYLDSLATVCRSAGLVVHEVDGWEHRARGSGGYDTGRPTHVMVHHTASNPGSDPDGDVAYIATGATDAPLANLYLSRTGEVWVIAGGATNTNGSGSAPWPGGCPDDQMNAHALGVEAANNGVGESWPHVQQVAYVNLCAALCMAYDIDTSLVRSHYEWTSRKVDVAGQSMYAAGSSSWNMTLFRDDVQAATLPEPPTPPPEDEVTEQDKKDIAALVWQEIMHNYAGGDDLPAVAMLGYTHANTESTNSKLDEILRKLS